MVFEPLTILFNHDSQLVHLKISRSVQNVEMTCFFIFMLGSHWTAYECPMSMANVKSLDAGEGKMR